MPLLSQTGIPVPKDANTFIIMERWDEKMQMIQENGKITAVEWTRHDDEVERFEKIE